MGSSSPLLAKTIPYLGLESLKTHTHTYIHYPKIVYALLNKTVSLMSYYSLPANSITPSLLMKIALIRGNCLSLLSKLLYRSPAPQYPFCSSVADLVNKFIGFLVDKLTTIRLELESNPKQGIHLFNEVSLATTRLHCFSCPSYSTSLKIMHP